MGNWLKTIRMTVNCPYCRTGYTFRSEEKYQEFKKNPTVPLHPACLKAQKDEEKRIRNKQSIEE